MEAEIVYVILCKYISYGDIDHFILIAVCNEMSEFHSSIYLSMQYMIKEYRNPCVKRDLISF